MTIIWVIIWLLAAIGYLTAGVLICAMACGFATYNSRYYVHVYLPKIEKNDFDMLVFSIFLMGSSIGNFIVGGINSKELRESSSLVKIIAVLFWPVTVMLPLISIVLSLVIDKKCKKLLTYS